MKLKQRFEILIIFWIAVMFSRWMHHCTYPRLLASSNRQSLPRYEMHKYRELTWIYVFMYTAFIFPYIFKCTDLAKIFSCYSKIGLLMDEQTDGRTNLQTWYSFELNCKRQIEEDRAKGEGIEKGERDKHSDGVK